MTIMMEEVTTLATPKAGRSFCPHHERPVRMTSRTDCEGHPFLWCFLCGYVVGRRTAPVTPCATMDG